MTEQNHSTKSNPNSCARHVYSAYTMTIKQKIQDQIQHDDPNIKKMAEDCLTVLNFIIEKQDNHAHWVQLKMLITINSITPNSLNRTYTYKLTEIGKALLIGIKQLKN